MKFNFIFSVVSITSTIVVGQGFPQLFAAQNKAGLPSEFLVETTNLGDPEQVERLIAQLENPEYQHAVRQAALKHSVELSRAMAEDWDDPELCGYEWLSWLPWLDCILVPEKRAPAFVFHDQGECYREK